MEDSDFDKMAREELAFIEDQFMDIDPDEVEVSSSDGVLHLDLRDGVRIVINSHRAARQIWMAAVADAWHFDYDASDKRWWSSKGEKRCELRETIVRLIKQRIDLVVAL